MSTLARSPSPSDPQALGDEIARMAAHLDAATHRLLTCIRQFDESEEWHRQGALSCAHWLGWRIGLDPATAREKVRVARALGALPRIDDALRRGVMSYAKVRAMTRVATAENEERLLELAHASTAAQLERICRSFRRVVIQQIEGRVVLDIDRQVRHHVLPSGMVRIQADLHPDEAALVLEAIEAARRAPSVHTTDAATDVSAETRAPAVPAPDALVHLAQTFLARVDEAPAAVGAVGTAGADRHQIFIHLDQDPLEPDGVLSATLDDGTRVSAETFRRVACDAAVVAVVDGPGGEPLNVGRRTRVISAPLRRALWLRDRGCRYPGCPNHCFVHAHHIHHWAHGGETSLANLVLLCGAHHRLLHEGGFSVKREGGTGDLVFRDTWRRVIQAAPPRSDISDDGIVLIEKANCAADLEIDSETNFPAWDGSNVDYRDAVDALLS